MQRDFLAFLRARPTAAVTPGAITSRLVEGEYELIRGGQVVSFVDAIEILDVGILSQSLRTVTMFEIKPVIDTVYGIVRQAKAQLQLARLLIPANVHVLHVVVPHDDPLLGDLRVEWPNTWAWGLQFKPYEDLDD